jgi:hypothetical protein
MFYRNITVNGKEYRYRVGESGYFILIRGEAGQKLFRSGQEFSDLSNYEIERNQWKRCWSGFHPHHIEKLIRKHFLSEDVEMTYFDFPRSYPLHPFKKPHDKYVEQIEGVIFVCGDFNDNGGRASGYAKKLILALRDVFPAEITSVFNGGNFLELQDILSRIQIEKPSAIFWFANVPNDKEKLIDQIKKDSPSSILISSKDNSHDRYTFPEIISKMLRVKANLSLIFHKGQAIHASLVDPLGNVFLDHERDVEKVAMAISTRVTELLGMTRIGSIKVGDAIPTPDDEETRRFVEVIHKQAQEFARLTPTVSTERMLGNASFRCKIGFPSIRKDNLIYVSRRNIDKTSIGLDGFVAVNTFSENVEYYGDCKPSVDTPIQLLLYRFYRNVRFMIHGHVRIQGAPETNKVIPCGAIQEAYEVFNLFPSYVTTNFCVNLKGHGCIILADNLDYFDAVTYIQRSIRAQI